MKIIYIGNFRPLHSTESHISKTLLVMGHEVHCVQEDETTVDQLHDRVESLNPKLILYTRTWGMKGDLMKFFKDTPVLTASYHLDLYAGLKRGEVWTDPEGVEVPFDEDPFWHTDVVFTPDGGSDEFFNKHNINHVYIKPGVYQPECYIAQTDGFKYDVAFVGSYGYHPEWPYRQILINWLRETYGDRFRKFGPPEETIRNHELNKVYAESKIVVGDTLCLNFSHSKYWSDRVYETLGRGGFLIHPYIQGLDEEFQNRNHLVYYNYGDFQQLKQLIDYYLNDENGQLEREQIRSNGHNFVKQHCTYTNRLQQVIDLISSGLYGKKTR